MGGKRACCIGLAALRNIGPRDPRTQGVSLMYDAIVIGGGVVGMSTAYHLLCGGARTLLVDRADPGRATDAGAGIL